MPDIAVELAMPPDMVIEPWDIPVIVEEGAAVVDIVMPDIEDMSMSAVSSAPYAGFEVGGLFVEEFGVRRHNSKSDCLQKIVWYALLLDVRCRELWDDVRRSAEWKRCRPFNAVDVDGESRKSFEMFESAEPRSTESAQSSLKPARCHVGCIHGLPPSSPSVLVRAESRERNTLANLLKSLGIHVDLPRRRC